MIRRTNNKGTAMRRLTKKIALCLTITFAAIVGYTGQSYAAGPLHQYFYNTSGIVHDTGHSLSGVSFYLGSTVYENRTVWETTGSDVDGSSSWYGPKPTIFGGATFHVCWDYTLPRFNNVVVVLDITYSANPTIILWSSGNKTLLATGNPYGPYQLVNFCHDIVLNGTSYDKFQIRAKAVTVSNDPDSSFLLYKTMYQTL